MKITIENTREHDIVINASSGSGVTMAVIPAAKQDPEDRNKLIHGTALVEEALLEKASKSPVVKHYFKEGWLLAKESEKAEPQDNGKRRS